MSQGNKQLLRDQIIKYGVDNNYDSKTIDRVLSNHNLKPYNPLTSKYNWEMMAKRLPENAKEFSKDALTFGGMLAKPAMDIIDAGASAPWGSKRKAMEDVITAYKNDPTVQKTLRGIGIGAAVGKAIGPIGTIPGGILGGMVGATSPKEFGNAMLSPYNTDVDTLFSGKADIRDIITGAQRNPVYAGLDILSVGKGSKLVGGITKNVANNISKNSPEVIRQFMPNEQLRDLNRSLSTELGNAKAKLGKNYDAYGILEGTIKLDRKELANHIMTGDSKLRGRQRTIADKVRGSLIDNEKIGIDLGLLDSSLSKADTVAQYVMQFIPRSYNLLHADYRDIILGRELDPRAKRIIKENNLKDSIDKLIDDGKKLYDKNGIAYLTQKLATTKDPLGEVIARERNAGKTNYFDITREIGRATPERLGKVLDDSIKFQLDQISYAKEFEGILDYILRDKNYVRNISEKEIANIKAKALKEISKDIANGDLPKLNNALSASGLKKVIFDPLYYKSINNLFKKPINVGIRRVLSQFKKNVLATPHWTIVNRMGNIPNNIMEGVTLTDYADTVKYKKYIPNQLKQQTSFSSYLNEGIDIGSDSASQIKRTPGSTWAIPYNKIKSALEKFKDSNKSIEDIGELSSSLYANVNDFIANPIFRMESSAELADRYANFIRQAKRLAKKRNVSVEKILKEAQEDNKLFHKLNTDVNKSLGDYVGRNYALPSGLYNFLGEVAPFYRFYNQTLRTTAHQLANHPYKFQTVIGAPTKIGREERERVQDKYKLDPEWYQGGVPYGVKGNNLRTMGLEQLPIQTVIGLGGDIGTTGDITSILNPIISSISPALKFETPFGTTASTPRLTEMKRRGEDTKNFKPTLEEKLRYLGNEALASTSSLYNWSQRLVPEFIAPFTGGLYSRYDTHPFTTNPDSYLKTLPSETIMKQLGVKTNSNYRKNKPKGKSSKKKIARNIRYQRKKETEQKKPLYRRYK